MPSRRALLSGVAGLVGGGLVADRVPIGDLEPWTPAADTWPLARHDLANTAAAPDVLVPAAATVDWRVDLRAPERMRDWRAALVVGPERVYAGTTELAALDRRDGTPAWRDGDPAPELALRDGRLFVGRGSGDGGTLAARDAATGERAWRHALPGPATGLTVVNGAALVPCDYHTVAHETGTGLRRWTAPDLSCRQQPLVHREALFMDDPGLARFQPRDALAVPFRGPPDPAWRASIRVVAPPVGVGNRVVAGSELVSPRADERSVLHGVDAAGGDTVWSAVESDERDVFVRSGHVAVDERERVYAATYRQWANTPRDGDYRSRVRALAAADGAESWGRTLPVFVRSVCYADDTVLVAGEATDAAPPSEPPGSVRALVATDGAERWRVGFDAPVVALAPVDGTVFALAADGTVAALR